ncbi:MAG: sugar phosphate isomerase/epimerase [Phycisphaerales bacterium]|nr:sugar phosphate isomerase/epimerase [Phycisphaerales bacterium]
MESIGADAARLAVCSWSLRAGSGVELVDLVRRCSLRHVQLALDPLRVGAWDERATRAALEAAEVSIVSGMMAPANEDYSTLESIRATGGLFPDATWEQNLEAAAANAALARRLGLSLVTLHAGWTPEDPSARRVVLRRLRAACAAFAEQGVRVAFETGQDPPASMIGVLEELREFETGVNFDPANMILYGSADPIEALRALAPWVLQAHVKDARPAPAPGEWGEEVAAGEGAVDWPRFFGVVRERLPAIDLAIERESGDRRAEDVEQGARLVRRLR